MQANYLKYANKCSGMEAIEGVTANETDRWIVGTMGE